MKNKIYIILSFIFLFGCEEKEPTFFEKEFLGTNSDGTIFENIVPNVYTGIPSSKRVLFLNESFDNNSNNWDIRNTAQDYLNIENGSYVFQNKTSSSKISALTKVIDTQQNFEIETNINITATSNNNGNGIVWGYTNVTDYLFFCYSISASQKLWIGYYQWNLYNPWQNWLQQNVNPIGSFNKLTIRKIENTYYFFINEQFIISEPFEPFFGNLIGFKSENYTTIYIDYLKIDYIKN